VKSGYERKLELYQKLISDLPAFNNPPDSVRVDEFINTRNELTVVAPDKVLRAINAFLDLQNHNKNPNPGQAALADSLRAILTAIRADAFSSKLSLKTDLGPEEVFSPIRASNTSAATKT
jgi:hypothetical protein